MIESILLMFSDETQRRKVAEIYKKHKNRFFNIAFSRLHTQEDAEDAVQEAFARIAKNPENFFKIPPHKRVAYIDVIIRNVSVDMFKKRQKESPKCDEDDCGEADEDFFAEEFAIGEIEYERLVEFILSMPRGMKEVLILRIQFDRSTAEIAEELQISHAAVRRRLSDARKQIREYLESENNEYV